MIWVAIIFGILQLVMKWWCASAASVLRAFRNPSEKQAAQFRSIVGDAMKEPAVSTNLMYSEVYHSGTSAIGKLAKLAQAKSDAMGLKSPGDVGGLLAFCDACQAITVTHVRAMIKEYKDRAAT